MREFRPIICRKKHIDLITNILYRFIYENYLLSIKKAIEPIEGYYNNSLEEDVIAKALREGQIQYINGAFKGKFNAQLTKALYSIGAKWNKRLKCFVIPKNKLSPQIIGTIGSSMVLAMTIRKSILDVLSYLTIENVMPDLKEILDIPLDTVLEDLENQGINSFRPIGAGSTKKYKDMLKEAHDRALGISKDDKEDKDSTPPKGGKGDKNNPPPRDDNGDKNGKDDKDKGKDDKGKSKSDKIRESISINPTLNDWQKEALKKEYTENVANSIKDFTDAQTIKLRELVEKNTREGLDNTNLIKEIQRLFDVSYNKAKFLARNETEAFTAKVAELQARNVGITHYKWMSIGDERTRPRHKMLSDESKNGVTYRYDTPPVTDAYGNRHNPGEDYNCRCVAIPVMPKIQIDKLAL